MFLGEAALSASGIAMPMILFIATIGGAVALGFQTVVARKLGQGDREGASSIFNYILVFALILSVVVLLCIMLFSKQLAVLLGTTRGSYEYAQVIGYMKGYAIGVPAYSLMILLTPVMFIDSDKDRITVATLVMVVVDIALDLMNVFVFKQEMFGMALASSISYIAAAIVLLMHFRKKDTAVSINLKDVKPVELSAIFKNSSTYTIYHICKALLTFGVNRLLIALGAHHEVAVFAALSSLALMLTSVGSAMGSVTLSFSSLFHGESDVSREEQLRKAFSLYSLIICGAISVITIAFAPLISSLFIKRDSPQFYSCVIGLCLLALSIALNAINNCYRNFFQGVDKLGISLTVCILQYLVAPVGALFILLLIDAGKWIWLFYIIGEVLTFIVAMLLKGKDKCAGRLDWETLIKKSDDTSAAIDMLKQTLSDNSVTDAKMQLVSKVLNTVAEIFSDADSQQAELNLRAYETDGVLKCSVETDLVDAECSENAYLGETVGDIRTYILDENGNETDDGEICFTGDFFNGYIGLPELTDKLLVDNPFKGRDGDDHEKMFHTRDQVKRLPDGRLVYIDRMDWMVKINGNRVELGEVENILHKLPEVKEVLVKGFKDSHGRAILCAYYISENGESLPKQYLADKLAEKLPAYMIPPFFVRLDEFPKNANGKLDRKALELPDINEFKKDYAPPENEIQAMLCHAMEHVLDTDLVGINDDFFDLGGDSLKSAALITELDKQGLTYSMIYDGRTPKQIAELIAEANNNVRTPEMALEERCQAQPLLPYQRYYLDYQLYSPNKIIATIPIYCSLPPETASPEAIKEALEKVFSHFAVFGTVFSFDSKMELVQRYEPELIPDIDISYVSERTFEDVIKPGFIRPFQLFDSLLWRCGIFVTPENTYILMDIYHAIGDRAMVRNMFRNIFNALEGKPLEEDLYYLYLHEQGELRKEAVSHAEEILKQMEESQSYSGFPHPDLEHHGTANGRFISSTLNTLSELQYIAEHYRCSLNNLIIAASATALGEYNDEALVRVRWTYNGREEDWEKPLVGITTESISTNIDLQKFNSNDDYIQEVKRQSMEGIRYSVYSAAFEDMSPGLSERMNIVYQNGSDLPENAPEGASLKSYFDYHTGSLSMFQIMINERAENEPLQVIFVYNKRKYKAESVAKFAEIFHKKLSDLLPSQSEIDTI